MKRVLVTFDVVSVSFEKSIIITILTTAPLFVCVCVFSIYLMTRALLEEMPSKGLKPDKVSYAAAMQVRISGTAQPTLCRTTAGSYTCVRKCVDTIDIYSSVS